MSGLHEWRLKEQLKQHRLTTFDGKADREGLLKWERSVEHFGRLAGLSEAELIDTAWHYFSPDVLDWFTSMMDREYSIQILPPPNGYPFSWTQFKTKLEKVYSSIFADKQAWINLENLRRGKNTAEYQTRFTELAGLVGLSPQTAGFRSRLWDIYHARMTIHEKAVLSPLILFFHETGQPLLVRHAIDVVDEGSMSSGLNVSLPNASNTMPAAVSTATNLIPGPMELGAISGRSSDTCARCKGEGHWTSVCPTPRHWKKGDKVAGFKPKYEGQRGTAMVKYEGGSKRREFGKKPDGKKAQSYSTELDAGKENSDNSDSGSEEGSEDPDSAEESESGKA